MRSILLCVCALLVGCSSARDPWKGTPTGQKKVVAFFPPIYCFTANVAKDQAKVICLLTGTGPHDYEPTPADARKLAAADLIFANGLDLDEELSKRLIKMARGKDDVLETIADALPHKLMLHNEEHDHEAGVEHKHQHGDHDSHAWLGMKQAQAMVGILAKKLAERDPGQKGKYEKNAEDYIAKLKELEAFSEEQFKDKKNRAIITQHESLRYFAKSFKLEIVQSISPQPGIEANAAQLAKLIDVCKKKNVSVIAVEPQYARRQAEALKRALKAGGVDATIVEVDPMETATPGADGNPSPDFYIDQMKRNIENLAKAMQ